MAEEAHKAQQHLYTCNSITVATNVSEDPLTWRGLAESNLVLQADRSALPRRDQEPSSDVTSLYGLIDPKGFGDRAMTTIKEQKDKIEKKRKQEAERASTVNLKSSRDLQKKNKKNKKDRDM